MCIPKKPKMPEQPVPVAPPPQPEKPPEPVAIKKQSHTKIKRKRNPLRIDLAQKAAGSSNSGVNI